MDEIEFPTMRHDEMDDQAQLLAENQELRIENIALQRQIERAHAELRRLRREVKRSDR